MPRREPSNRLRGRYFIFNYRDHEYILVLRNLQERKTLRFKVKFTYRGETRPDDSLGGARYSPFTLN